MTRKNRLILAAALLVVGASVSGACVSHVGVTACFEWTESETCPSREQALFELDDVDEVKSDGTFWPAHAYTVNGAEIPIAAECCYEVEVTQRTTELH